MSKDLSRAHASPALRDLAPHERLYKGGREAVERVKALSEAARLKREQDNLDQCTFRPSLSQGVPPRPSLSPAERPPWSLHSTPESSPLVAQPPSAAAAAGSPQRPARSPGAGGTPAMQLSPEQLEQIGAKLRAASYTIQGQNLSGLFARFDDNKDGTLSAAELGTHLKKMLPGVLSAVEMGQLCAAFDEDGDGMVDRDEFVRFCTVGAGAHSTAAQGLDALERNLLEQADGGANEGSGTGFVELRAAAADA